MFSPEQLNSLIREISSRLGSQQCAGGGKNHAGGCGGGNSALCGGGDSGSCNPITLTATQLIVIAGILGGVLAVDSVLVDRDQIVQIVLEGSLKRKTELDKMLDKMGSMPFDDVLKAMLERL